MSKKLNGFIAGVLCTAALGGLAYGGIKVYKQYIYKPADNISATIDGKEYENLEDAFSYGAPLTLQKDITADGMLTINTSVVIDMNAHKITSPVNVVGNTITLKNGVIENSVATVPRPVIVKTSSTGIRKGLSVSLSGSGI